MEETIKGHKISSELKSKSQYEKLNCLVGKWNSKSSSKCLKEKEMEGGREKIRNYSGGPASNT